jgi:hypothetical protein
MTDNTTYYAILDVDGNMDQPIGVFRRVKNDSGQIDEVFSRNLKWEFSPLLYSAERGDTTYDFSEIPKEDADQIVDRIRAQASHRE